MNNFKKQFKQGDDYCDIRADYRSLISIGKSVEETEDLLLRAYCPKEGDLLFTPTFWLSLGICEWETGRLTPRTKEEALYCLSLYQETVEQRLNAGPNERLSDMLQFFRETQEMLLSPLPEAKKISKPYARKCPWREGSLLAYQILSPEMKNFCFPRRYLRAPQWTECELRERGYFDIPANPADTSPVFVPRSSRICGIPLPELFAPAQTFFFCSRYSSSS